VSAIQRETMHLRRMKARIRTLAQCQEKCSAFPEGPNPLQYAPITVGKEASKWPSPRDPAKLQSHLTMQGRFTLSLGGKADKRVDMRQSRPTLIQKNEKTLRAFLLQGEKQA
jgi:hypothetical protein